MVSVELRGCASKVSVLCTAQAVARCQDTHLNTSGGSEANDALRVKPDMMRRLGRESGVDDGGWMERSRKQTARPINLASASRVVPAIPG